MGLFFTNNKVASSVSNILDAERITEVFVQAWAGRGGDAEFFRVGNDGTTDREITLYSSSPDIELSSNGRSWYQGVDYSVQAGGVGDAVFVRAVADLDAIEGDKLATISADGTTLTVRYFLAEVNEGDTDRSQAYRFSGDNSAEIREFFDTEGEALNVIEYEPQPKPLDAATNPTTLIELNNRSVREWCNPFNQVVGFKSRRWLTKGFVGDRDQLLNSIYDIKELSFSFGDSNSVLLPYDFEGFDPTWRQRLVSFGTTAYGIEKYQGTVWTLYRDNQEYALRNIKRVGFFRGQILFYLADLVRIHYPGGANETSFLPWNEVLDVDWKPIDYVRSWSVEPLEEPYEPYLGESDELNPSATPAEPEADCPACPECPEQETAPEPVSATLSGNSLTLTVTFDKPLQTATLDTSNWRWFDGDHRYAATEATASGTQVVCYCGGVPVGLITSPSCTYDPPPHDVIGENGYPVYAFEGFGIT